MTDTKTFSPDDIADYLEEEVSTDDHDLGNISTCIKVIAKYPFGDVRRDHDILVAAVENIVDFFDDFKVFIEKVAIEKIDGDQIVLTS